MCFLLADWQALCSWIWPPFWMYHSFDFKNKAWTMIYLPKIAQGYWYIVRDLKVGSQERGCRRIINWQETLRHLQFQLSSSLLWCSRISITNIVRLFLFPFNLFQLHGAIAYPLNTALWETHHCGSGRYGPEIKKHVFSVITILLATQQNTANLFSVRAHNSCWAVLTVYLDVLVFNCVFMLSCWSLICICSCTLYVFLLVIFVVFFNLSRVYSRFAL